MSSVSQVGAGSSLYDLLQNISDGSGSNASQSSGASATGTADSSSQAVGASSGHHHHHGGGGGKGFQQIQSAVTTALQSAPDDSDPNQIIQDAIANALKAKSAQSAQQTPGNPANASVTDPADSSATAAPDPSDFKSLLASYGVDQQQFQQDFQAAVKQSGVTFPTGSQTDVTA